MKAPLIPVPHGELVDKLTILDIKLERIADAAKYRKVAEEHGKLDRLWGEQLDKLSFRECMAANSLRSSLHLVNSQLWDVEDRLRAFEARQQWDDKFVQAARSVYQLNDRRATFKRQVSELFQSELIEVKEHPNY